MGAPADGGDDVAADVEGAGAVGRGVGQGEAPGQGAGAADAAPVIVANDFTADQTPSAVGARKRGRVAADIHRVGGRLVVETQHIGVGPGELGRQRELLVAGAGIGGVAVGIGGADEPPDLGRLLHAVDLAAADGPDVAVGVDMPGVGFPAGRAERLAGEIHFAGVDHAVGVFIGPDRESVGGLSPRGFARERGVGHGDFAAGLEAVEVDLSALLVVIDHEFFGAEVAKPHACPRAQEARISRVGEGIERLAFVGPALSGRLAVIHDVVVVFRVNIDAVGRRIGGGAVHVFEALPFPDKGGAAGGGLGGVFAEDEAGAAARPLVAGAVAGDIEVAGVVHGHAGREVELARADQSLGAAVDAILVAEAADMRGGEVIDFDALVHAGIGDADLAGGVDGDALRIAQAGDLLRQECACAGVAQDDRGMRGVFGEDDPKVAGAVGREVAGQRGDEEAAGLGARAQ